MLFFDLEEKEDFIEIVRCIQGLGVYCLVSGDNDCLYVGQSTQLKQRLIKHKIWINHLYDTNNLRKIGILHANASELNMIESKLIHKFRPVYNVIHKNKKETLKISINSDIYIEYLKLKKDPCFESEFKQIIKSFIDQKRKGLVYETKKYEPQYHQREMLPLQLFG